LNSDWYCVYVQTPAERGDRIDSIARRRLAENIQIAQRMGAEIVKLEGTDVAAEICRFAKEKNVRLAIVGQSHRGALSRLLRRSAIHDLVNNTQSLDVLVAGFERSPSPRTPQ
jgi:two-component system sensor histidine kinase KdpD